MNQEETFAEILARATPGTDYETEMGAYMRGWVMRATDGSLWYRVGDVARPDRTARRVWARTTDSMICYGLVRDMDCASRDTLLRRASEELACYTEDNAHP